MQRCCFGVSGLALAAVLLAPALAQAAPAIVTTRLNMRAGPGTEYPVVARLEQGVQVEVLGCLEGYGWCDIAIGQDRGWAAGAYLQVPYDERREPLMRIAPAIGLPVVGFAIGSYWDSYYRNRPWYRERGRWDHRPPPPPPRRAFGPGPGPGPGWGSGGPRFDGPGRGGPPPGPRFDRGPGPGPNAGPGSRPGPGFGGPGPGPGGPRPGFGGPPGPGRGGPPGGPGGPPR
ncbi:SH3 domain-containing protein [Roseomonas marmotae]|uniref:SH3 domain-containing protein n=1 Tax=Roseomonas marmotae TaxID=2768161 RepID=A0ABS3K7F8_9PROT|nr:SH3 domain-containing protein [Roseomonas marmotae]MBO1073411.1 SH3 domain-containing protein [Roseomonas marmotae]QTI80391.1 SH3 domain-containing protein [Roseomonas marmotae]